MLRINVTKNFYLDEFYDVKTYHMHYEANNLHYLIQCLDKDLLFGLQEIRDFINSSMTINNWWSTYVKTNYNLDATLKIVKAKQLRQWSGVRNKTSEYYSKTSMHSNYKAVDPIFKTNKLLTIAQAFVYYYWEDIKITRMEVNVSWLHVDTKHVPNQTSLFTFDVDSAEPTWKPKWTKEYIDNYKLLQ